MASQLSYLATADSHHALTDLAEAEGGELKRATLNEEVKPGMAPPVCRICPRRPQASRCASPRP